MVGSSGMLKQSLSNKPYLKLINSRGVITPLIFYFYKKGIQMEKETTLKEEIANLDDSKDKYIITIAKMSENGKKITYKFSSWNFPIADLMIASKRISKLIQEQHRQESKKLDMNPVEQQAYETEQRIKQQLTIE